VLAGHQPVPVRAPGPPGKYLADRSRNTEVGSASLSAKSVAMPDWVPEAPARDGKTETNVAELAGEILIRDQFARDPGGRLYVFRNGVYQPSGELVVRQRVKGIMNHWGIAENWTAQGERSCRVHSGRSPRVVDRSASGHGKSAKRPSGCASPEAAPA